MDIPQTLIAVPSWVAAQDPTRWLTPQEQALCNAAASPRRRADRRAGRLALKRLLWETFDVPPLTYEIGSVGPAPILSLWPGPPDLTVSLSHSAGLGAASWAWGKDEGEIGIDAQWMRPVHPGLRARVLTESEQALDADILLLWSLKEAAIKARRRSWGRALNEVVVTTVGWGETGEAQIAIAGEPPLKARYARHGDWWLARAVRPGPSSFGRRG